MFQDFRNSYDGFERFSVINSNDLEAAVGWLQN